MLKVLDIHQEHGSFFEVIIGGSAAPPGISTIAAPKSTADDGLASEFACSTNLKRMVYFVV